MNKLSLLLALQPIALSLSLEGCSSDRLRSRADKVQIPLSEETQSETSFVYDTIGGEIIFTINAGTSIESVPTEDPEWNELAVTVAISSDEASSNEIAEGETLTNLENEKIGRVEKFQRLCDKDQEGTIAMGVLRGFTKRSNINPQSVLENIIQKICSSEKNCTLTDMEEIVNGYDFVNYQFDNFLEHLDIDQREKYNGLESIEEYVLEDSWLSDPGSDRLSLIFLHQQLIAIVHKRPLKIKHTLTYELPKKRQLIVFPYVDMDLTDKLLHLKTEFYSNFFD